MNKNVLLLLTTMLLAKNYSNTLYGMEMLTLKNGKKAQKIHIHHTVEFLKCLEKKKNYKSLVYLLKRCQKAPYSAIEQNTNDIVFKHNNLLNDQGEVWQIKKDIILSALIYNSKYGISVEDPLLYP